MSETKEFKKGNGEKPEEQETEEGEGNVEGSGYCVNSQTEMFK